MNILTQKLTNLFEISKKSFCGKSIKIKLTTKKRCENVLRPKIMLVSLKIIFNLE